MAAFANQNRRPAYRTLIGLLGWLLAFVAFAAPLASAAEMTLVTTSGDRFRGQWVQGDEAKDVYWESGQFVGPFRYSPDALMAIYGPRDKDEEEKKGLCICELLSGDVLVGMPVGLDEDSLSFALEQEADKPTQVVKIPRKMLLRLTAPMRANEMLVMLPGDGEALKKNLRGEWEFRGGKVNAKSDGAKCFAPIPDLPQRCMVEIEIAWEDKTDFAVSLTARKREVVKKAEQQQAVVWGRQAGQRKLKEPGEHLGLRLESWHDQVVLVAKTKGGADLLPIEEKNGGRKAGNLRLQILVDADKLFADVYRDGAFVGKLKLPADMKTKWRKYSEVARLESFSGRLSLESFRVSSWNGHAPASATAKTSVIRMKQGKTVPGLISGWDKESQSFLVVDAGEPASKKPEPSEKEDASEGADDDKEPSDEESEESEDKSDEDAEDESDAEDEPEEEADTEEPVKPKTRKVAMADMTEIVFAGSSSKKDEDDKKPGSLALTTKRGSLITGMYHGVEGGKLRVQSDGLDQEVVVSIDQIIAANFSALEKPEEGDNAVGTLVLNDSMMRGYLVSAEATDDATCLSWRPLLAKNSRPLVEDASGTIIYRETKKKPAPKPVSQQPVRRRGVIGGFAQVLKKAANEANSEDKPERPIPKVKATDMMTLELRSGDSIPFRPKRIDEEGVTFESPFSDVTFVSHEKIKAITLRSKVAPAELTEIKRERLLTVPRRYKDRPPTHLFLSVNKDILRGRLVAMTDDHVTVEIRLDERKIPRERVAAIVWLDSVKTEGDPEKKDSGAAGEEDDPAVADGGQGGRDDEASPSPGVWRPEGFHVLATKRGGQRITILPQSCKDGVLLGSNPVLEACQLDLKEVDQLAFGTDVEEVVGKLAHSQITLTAAADPRFMSEEEGGSGGGNTGAESGLVGKPAPEIELKDLNGKKYDLADEKGKIVVLDFWATWCGPCIQWMPKAEGIVEQFADDNVELVAVNLSETEDVIRPVLKRLDLNPKVILDIDGVVAQSYKANAIPQTVVIDRDGNVDRVIVGGGKQNEELLRKSIQELVDQG